MRTPVDLTKCSRCKEAAPTITIRKEKFCDACFVFFINYKFRKPLDSYKVNYQSEKLQTLVVDVDFQLASMCLVKLLEETLDYQRLKHSRVGFEVRCIYVGDSEFEWPFQSPLQRVPSSVLAQNYKLDGSSYLDSNDLSRTSKQDLQNAVRRDTVFKLAKGNTVLESYSMSTLSELILAETCKGRGGLIPQLLNPADSIYPLRDILDSELEIYARVMNVTFEPAPLSPRVSRLQSIDELVHEFVAKTRQDFPAVDSTVARTGHKLADLHQSCSLCTHTGSSLCYGCQAMLEGRVSKKTLEVLDQFEL